MSLVLNSLSSIAQLVLVVTGVDALIFGLLGIVNRAHTGLMTIGVYIAISIRSTRELRPGRDRRNDRGRDHRGGRGQRP